MSEPQQPKFEELAARLQIIVDKLEKETLDLEEMTALYKEGTHLAAECSQMLEEAEMSIKTLMAGKQDAEDSGSADS